ncbi:MAG: thioredoxin fold domain-containing protein [Gammaproteobacteria bacterium]|nr:thioredoxin fold domain-containing protein [Gammaproteobacteria bacterium]
MRQLIYNARAVYLVFLLLPAIVHAAGETELTPAMVNPGHEEQPDWFKVSFLDLYEDIAEAADENKRLMVYFFQDGCPYCKILLEDNFGQREITDKTRKYFDVVTLNIWGDREVTVGDKVMTEKDFAAALKVQYTPTLIFFDENRKAVYRANGYYPPEKFDVVLDYVGQKKERELGFQDYLAQVAPQPASGKLHTEVTNVASIGNLQAALEKDKYLLVIFGQKQCATCDELHLDILQREESKALLEGLNVAVIDLWSDRKIVTPDGSEQKIADWAKKLDIKYAPSLVYYNDSGEEVFRSDAYLRAFHVQSVMEYVTTAAYKEQPNFQRYVDTRADHLREQGIEVNLMD